MNKHPVWRFSESTIAYSILINRLNAIKPHALDSIAFIHLRNNEYEAWSGLTFFDLRGRHINDQCYDTILEMLKS